jgi:hypothetical protein
MGTIVKRSRRDGSAAWLAQLVIKRGSKIVLRENKTFELRSTANAWLNQREDRLGQPGALEAALKSKSSWNQDPTLSDAIDLYIRESNKKIGGTKALVLRSIKDFDIADKTCASITCAYIVAFAREKLESGVQPQTVSNHLSHLGAVFAIARPA